MAIDPIETKISSFQEKRPELAFMPRDVVISIMLKEGAISQNELDALPPHIFPISKDLSVGDAFTIQAKSLTEQPTKQKIHEKYPFLLLNDEGNIAPNQFTLESFKQRYGKEFNVTGDDNCIKVKDKNGNIKIAVCAFETSNKIKNISITNINEDKSFTNLLLVKNGVKYDKYQITTLIEGNKEEGWRKEHHFDVMGNVTETKVFGNNNQLTDDTIYENGQTKELIKNGELLYIKDLQQILSPYNRKFLGKIKSNEQKEKELVEKEKYIQESSLNDFFEAYKLETGSNYIDDVYAYFNNDFGMTQKHLRNLENSILGNNLAQNNETKNKMVAGTKSNSAAFEDLYKGKSIESDNFIYLTESLIKKYPDIFKDIENSKLSDGEKNKVKFEILKKLIEMPRNPELIKIFFDNAQYIFGKDSNEYKTCQTITTLEEQENFYANYFKQLIGTDSFLHDFYNGINTQNKNNFYVDYLRALNARAFAMLGDDTVKDKIAINGKIDLDFTQGSVGDCWLLAGIMAIKDKPNGEQYLNSLIEYDDKTGNITVNLKGVNKKYIVSKSELETERRFSTGDGDLRAIEIAVDRYIGENAHKDKDFRIDADGNYIHYAWKLLLGDGQVEKVSPTYQKNKKLAFINPDTSKYDTIINGFNNPNKAYTFAFVERDVRLNMQTPFFTCTNTETNEQVEMFKNHVYSVVKADEEFVYFRNPHDSSKMYKVRKDFFKTFYAEIASTNLPASKAKTILIN